MGDPIGRASRRRQHVYRDRIADSPAIDVKNLTGTTAIRSNNFGRSGAVYIERRPGIIDGAIDGLTACGNTIRSTPNQPTTC